MKPLTKPYMESMKKMKEFAPQIEKLKRKHKGDKQKLAQAQAEFYKQKGINPGAGCLPYLLQIIILIALFNVFSKVLSANGSIIEKLNPLLYGPLTFSPGETLNTKFLYLDVARPDTFAIAGFPVGIPGPLLIITVLVQMFSAKMMSPAIETQKKVASATKETADDFQAAFQSSAVYTFPLLTIVFGSSFASGLVLYWLVFSLSQAFTQYKSSGWGGATSWLKAVSLLK